MLQFFPKKLSISHSIYITRNLKYRYSILFNRVVGGHCWNYFLFVCSYFSNFLCHFSETSLLLNRQNGFLDLGYQKYVSKYTFGTVTKKLSQITRIVAFFINLCDKKIKLNLNHSIILYLNRDVELGPKLAFDTFFIRLDELLHIQPILKIQYSFVSDTELYEKSNTLI